MFSLPKGKIQSHNFLNKLCIGIEKNIKQSEEEKLKKIGNTDLKNATDKWTTKLMNSEKHDYLWQKAKV